MPTIYETELPGALFDALIEDAVPAIAGATPTLINLDPERAEDTIPRASPITLDIATLDATGTIDLATVRVYVGGVLAFNAGTFQAGFTGPASAYSNPQADVLRVIVDRTADFTSEQLVVVRVVAQAAGDAGILDDSYSFTVEDFAAPILVTVEAQDLQRVRCTFNEDVTTSLAILAANWRLDRFGDYLDPVVSAVVVSGEYVTSRAVDLYTDIPLTPSGHYRMTALTGLTDVHGNPVAADTFVDFTGWQPPIPDGREFDLYRKLPSLNRQEDTSLDLYRFTACLKEVAGLLLYDIDRFIEIIDPDTAPEAFVDAMLADLGNPFAFDLSLDDKRRLAQVLVDIYRLKGTSVGITAVIRFFLGLDVTVDAFNLSSGTWILGDSEVGVTSILGTDDSALLYSFTVTSIIALTVTQREQLTSIVEYMKPAHTHFVRLVEPAIITVLDHWELGLSELGETSFLH